MFKGHVAQAPWKINWFCEHVREQTPQVFKVYPVAHTHLPPEITWWAPQE